MRSVLQLFVTGVLLVFVGLSLSACGGGNVSPANMPIPPETMALMHKKGLKEKSPVFLRIFKKESALEIWKQRDDGRYALLKTYPICAWSGGVGPKLKQGDKQAPEGFYFVPPYQMNPNSNYHLAFNIGYPNKLDKSYNRTGNFLMVHGDCRSAGCYAMTDALIEEIYAIIREAFSGGQKKFQVQALPFRMTDANMRRYGQDRRWAAFWRDLKKGYDAFEMTRIPPKIDVCERRYLVNAAFEGKVGRLDASGPCPRYHNYIPDIMETPDGPKVVEADMNNFTPYSDPNTVNASLDATSAIGGARVGGVGALSGGRDLPTIGGRIMRGGLGLPR